MSTAPGPLLLADVRPVAFGPGTPRGPLDILVGGDGRIAAVGPSLAAPAGVTRIDGKGAWVSPGWIDLHAHVWHGGTDISIRPSLCGVERGVATIVDAGSAGEASFEGFREFVIDRARERIRAFLNIGSIGLVACNRVSELIDIRSIDIDRTIACVEKHRDVIVGLKVRASHVILGSWGITPVKVAKKVAKILKLPLMVHVGEPPPLYDEVLGVLGPGDVVTHCFNGKAGGSLIEDEDLFALAERCAGEGIRLDVGHGGASFSFRVAEVAIKRGLLPFSISTDLHNRSLDNPVWDLATTMSKLLAIGMPFDKVVEATTLAPASVIGLPTDGLLGPGARAEFTVFEVRDADLRIVDSMGDAATLSRLIEPRWTILGAEAIRAGRYEARGGSLNGSACPHCGWVLSR
ncbi:amidohydrolase/deacetylase family metallohydrolase [Chelatococcus sp. SYSU_G07232]|uniref:Amidohydrolase/deacetylase family metallohydrolase n=1 Tax=Chelatococcus albus TaxID=3047466 RepID=A0ABT7AHG2_9HYPH|nr:amidohydrolase/deacetylase family metallohydrolase [Chelatococcus sp. SYSU_G07232]MDJ1158826.1 amidohydrolase/deacetylase family metallohydrolase [Chelatococcus sp. SYSU_G07232]